MVCVFFAKQRAKRELAHICRLLRGIWLDFKADVMVLQRTSDLRSKVRY